LIAIASEGDEDVEITTKFSVGDKEITYYFAESPTKEDFDAIDIGLNAKDIFTFAIVFADILSQRLISFCFILMGRKYAGPS